jgi:hypothetical protein
MIILIDNPGKAHKAVTVTDYEGRGWGDGGEGRGDKRGDWGVGRG